MAANLNGKVVVSKVTVIMILRLHWHLTRKFNLNLKLPPLRDTVSSSCFVCSIFSLLCCSSNSDSERWTKHEHMYADETTRNAPSLSLLSCTRRLRFQLWSRYRHGDGPSSFAAYAIALSRATCGVAMLAWYQGSESVMDCA